MPISGITNTGTSLAFVDCAISANLGASGGSGGEGAIRTAIGRCQSKGANIFVLRGPFLASFVIRTLRGGRHVGTEQNAGRASSRLPTLPSFGVFVGNLEVVIGPFGQPSCNVGARIGRPPRRRSFGFQRAAGP